MDIERRFYELCERMKLKGGTDDIWQDLSEHYNEPHRKYHNLDHIEFGLTQFDRLRKYPDWLEFAWFCHDVIYEIGSENNEISSNIFSRNILAKAKVGIEIRDLVGHAIMATEHKDPPKTYEQKLIVDIDLATLGIPRQEFTKYQMKIRAEYPNVPEEDFWRGHKEILKRFIDRPTVYYSDFFHYLYEGQARENINWTLQFEQDEWVYMCAGCSHEFHPNKTCHIGQYNLSVGMSLECGCKDWMHKCDPLGECVRKEIEWFRELGIIKHGD
jgi:predicted metal-dependent HD superfamily phosphohydrolase